MKKFSKSLFVLLFLAVAANAQERTIPGTITSQDDCLPVPGVDVGAEGRQVGIGNNSKFSLKVSEVVQKNSITHLALLI